MPEHNVKPTRKMRAWFPNNMPLKLFKKIPAIARILRVTPSGLMGT